MAKVLRTPEQQMRHRDAWCERAAQVGNVRPAGIRLGIARTSVSKWRKRCEGEPGRREALLDRPRRQVKKALRRRWLARRERTHLGPARRRALLRVAGGQGVPSVATIAKVVKQAGLTRKRRAKPKRYRRVFVVPRPGDLVQLDVKWVPYLVEGRQLYQFTAIDCCTRLRLVSLAEEMTISTAKAFAPYVLSTFPFAVRLVQPATDRIVTPWDPAGPQTPWARPVQAPPFPGLVASCGAPPRLIPPRTPRRTGRVDRAHQTDDQEFYHRRRYAPRAALRCAFARWLWHSTHPRVHPGARLRGRPPLPAYRAFPAYRAITRLKCYPC